MKMGKQGRGPRQDDRAGIEVDVYFSVTICECSVDADADGVVLALRNLGGRGRFLFVGRRHQGIFEEARGEA